MFSPIPGWGALVGISFAFACLAPWVQLSAGVVAPTEGDARAAAETSVSGAPVANAIQPNLLLQSASVTSDAQAFWFPGADINSMNITSVPVRASEIDSALPGTEQHPLIPLPPAAWSGLSGLLALGAVKLLRNVRTWLA